MRTRINPFLRASSFLGQPRRLLLLGALVSGAGAIPVAAQCSGWTASPYSLPGFNQRVTVLYSWDPDGAGPLPPVIVAGGDMTSSGATTLGYMAKWDPAANGGVGAWATIGGGTDAEVNCFVGMPNGDLIAGGLFSNAGSPLTPAAYIARFNGASWSAMSTGMNSAVWSLVVRPAPTPELYASGWFTQAGSAITRVARWTGTAWAGTPSSGSGFNDWTWALNVLPGTNTLVVAGAFSTYNGAATRRVATYNGTTWSQLGGGVTAGSEIYELFVMPNGDLIASGNFTQIGGVAARNVARFNGTSWSAMGAGFPLPARDFAIVSGDLYAANVLAEDFTGPAIAKWDGTAWARIAFANSTIFALLPLANGDLLVGGSFNNVEGLAANMVAVYRPGGASGSPQISQQPAPDVACGPGTASYSVAAAGSGLTYQWQWRRIGQAAWQAVITGANSDGVGFFQSVGGLATSTDISNYHEGGVGPGGATKLEVRCIVSSACASTTSDSATLTINSADFNGDGDIGTDADIGAYFACLSGNCCTTCGTADFNADGNIGTDQDIEGFFRVLAGGSC